MTTTKLTLTQVTNTPKTSARTNKPYVSQSLKATQYGDRFISGFQNKETANWKAGDEVEVIIEESEKLDKNNQPYLNWSLSKKEDPIMTELSKIHFSVAHQHQKLDKILEILAPKKDKPSHPMPTFEKRPQEEIDRDAAAMKVAEEETAKDLREKQLNYDKLNGDLNAIAEEEHDQW